MLVSEEEEQTPPKRSLLSRKWGRFINGSSVGRYIRNVYVFLRHVKGVWVVLDMFSLSISP
ncbi:hypothetical protein KSX_13910 [Ktedonospora formicarum]|uniref:Uncharacterized protein n=1 Tax=Ktedonospora formicarum TaxID=2778364 RepID=A0A8J3MR26_9CHLR|nr:hypothetical protein KSX_13910 [Ktedonospora formicarum]